MYICWTGLLSLSRGKHHLHTHAQKHIMYTYRTTSQNNATYFKKQVIFLLIASELSKDTYMTKIQRHHANDKSDPENHSKHCDLVIYIKYMISKAQWIIIVKVCVCSPYPPPVQVLARWRESPVKAPCAYAQHSSHWLVADRLLESLAWRPGCDTSCAQCLGYHHTLWCRDMARCP